MLYTCAFRDQRASKEFHVYLWYLILHTAINLWYHATISYTQHSFWQTYTLKVIEPLPLDKRKRIQQTVTLQGKQKITSSVFFFFFFDYYFFQWLLGESLCNSFVLLYHTLCPHASSQASWAALQPLWRTLFSPQHTAVLPLALLEILATPHRYPAKKKGLFLLGCASFLYVSW